MIAFCDALDEMLYQQLHKSSATHSRQDYGRRGFRSWWGWPRGYDTWAVPYTESTLIIDIIDARTNQLVWRGYNRDDINLGKPDKDFVHAVDQVLKKFYSDAKKSAPKATS